MIELRGKKKKKFRRQYREYCKLEQECIDLGIYEEAFPIGTRKFFDKKMSKQILKVEKFKNRKLENKSNF